MIPLILAAVGGYLVSDSLSSRKKFAKGGGVEGDGTDNYAQQLEHRLKMVKDDLNVLLHFIKEQGLEEVFSRNTQIGGEAATVNLSNIEIACDLNDDESLSWGMFKKGGVPKVGVNLDENEEQTVYLKVKPRFNDELNEKAEKENLHLEFIEDDEDGYEVYRAEMTRVQLSDFKKEIPFTYSFKR